MYEGVQIHGSSGQPVLLLPGGHVSATGFYPGFIDGLVDDPGARVIVHDRPGTGTSTQEGSLAEAAAHLHSLVQDLDMGPVVVVGQSLGGAVALLFARDFPDDVAGLVLLDATPINDATVAGGTEKGVRALADAEADPEARRAGMEARAAQAEQMIQALSLADEQAEALRRIVEVDMAELAESARGLGDLAAAFDASDLPHGIPAAVVSADYSEDDESMAACMRAHERLAEALGAPLLRWQGSTHAVHLDHATESLDVIRKVTREAAAASGTTR
ncbi:alpha/beta fold hydrolase [Microbacterium saperdae]